MGGVIWLTEAQLSLLLAEPLSAPECISVREALLELLRTLRPLLEDGDGWHADDGGATGAEAGALEAGAILQSEALEREPPPLVQLLMPLEAFVEQLPTLEGEALLRAEETLCGLIEGTRIYG